MEEWEKITNQLKYGCDGNGKEKQHTKNRKCWVQEESFSKASNFVLKHFHSFLYMVQSIFTIRMITYGCVGSKSYDEMFKINYKKDLVPCHRHIWLRLDILIILIWLKYILINCCCIYNLNSKFIIYKFDFLITTDKGWTYWSTQFHLVDYPVFDYVILYFKGPPSHVDILIDDVKVTPIPRFMNWRQYFGDRIEDVRKRDVVLRLLGLLDSVIGFNGQYFIVFKCYQYSELCN